jgi:hypothetical protein
MKKIIAIIALLALCAAPAVADTWEITFTELSPGAEYAIFYYGERDPAMQSADEFIKRTNLTATPNLPLNEMATIEIDYPEGTSYSIYGKVFNAAGDSDLIMDDMGAYLSPTVWNRVAFKPVGEAHDVNVDGAGTVSVDVNVSVKTTYTVE